MDLLGDLSGALSAVAGFGGGAVAVAGMVWKRSRRIFKEGVEVFRASTALRDQIERADADGMRTKEEWKRIGTAAGELADEVEDFVNEAKRIF